MVEPNIIKTKYYTLVSADTGHGKTLWCKKKVARLLRTTQDRIIVIDVTGNMPTSFWTMTALCRGASRWSCTSISSPAAGR